MKRNDNDKKQSNRCPPVSFRTLPLKKKKKKENVICRYQFASVQLIFLVLFECFFKIMIIFKF